MVKNEIVSFFMKLNQQTTVVIMQPYFLPYRNYYSLIHKADHFVIYDDVQFCRKWQQRNSILCRDGKKIWLTVPIISRRPVLQLIKDVKIHNKDAWQGRMLAQIRKSYKDHPYFSCVYPELEKVLKGRVDRLVDLIVPLLQWSASKIGIHMPNWHWSSEIGGRNLERTKRLVYICQLLDATEYLVGPAARAYLKKSLFEEVGIRVSWHEDVYPDYPQLISQEFDHYVSILDLLMNCGPKSAKYLESCK